MKALVVSTSYPMAGAETAGIFVARLVDEIAVHCEVTVIAPATPQSDGAYHNGNVTVIPFRYAPKRLQTLAQQPGGIPGALKKNPLAYLLVPFFLLGMLIAIVSRSKHHDLIHANWAICGTVSNLFSSKPVITTLRGEDVTRAQRGGIDKLILSYCLRRSTRIVAVSESIQKWLKSNYPIAADRTELIKNGVSEALLNVGEQRTLRTGTPLRLISIGSLIPRKAVHIVIDAIRIVLNEFPNSVNLTIAGDGPLAASLRQQAADAALTDEVAFIGIVNPEQLPDLYAQNDVMVLASHSEGRPNVVIESMSCGLPVIATDIDGVRDLVTNDRGFLFARDASNQLAVAIKKFITQPELAHRLGRNAYDFMRRDGGTWSDTAQAYSELYQRTIQSTHDTVIG